MLKKALLVLCYLMMSTTSGYTEEMSLHRKEQKKKKSQRLKREEDLRAVTELLDLPVPDDRFDFQEDKPMNFICCLTFCEFVFLPFVASIKKSSFRTKRGEEK